MLKKYRFVLFSTKMGQSFVKILWDITYLYRNNLTIKNKSVVVWEHINLGGTYDFSNDALSDEYNSQREQPDHGVITLSTTICHSDFNNDGDVDGSDLAVFATDFGQTDYVTPPPWEGDFGGNGDVNGSDLAVFAMDFGRTDCHQAKNQKRLPERRTAPRPGKRFEIWETRQDQQSRQTGAKKLVQQPDTNFGLHHLLAGKGDQQDGS